VHDTHHPIAGSLYYEDQREEARSRTADFLKNRAPKYLGWFERILERNQKGARKGYLLGGRLSYPDLSLFQIVAGLRYAFPNAMRRIERDCPRVLELHERVKARPRIAAYLASARRIPFNEEGIFRHYPELDVRG
jgi:glutathione S-transferase